MSYLLTTIGPLIEWVLQPSRLHGTPTKIFIGYLWVDYGLYWSRTFEFLSKENLSLGQEPRSRTLLGET